jgi:hypothetical protein
MQFLHDLIGYARTHRRWWLLPLILMLVLISLLLAVTQGPLVTPFVYTLF